jgi:hypothetical protein
LTVRRGNIASTKGVLGRGARLTACSGSPTVETKHPRFQSVPRGNLFVFFLINADDFRFNTCTIYETKYLGAMVR